VPGNPGWCIQSFFIIVSRHSFLVNGLNIGEKNVGTIDRIIRIVAGIAILAGVLMNMVASPLSYPVRFVGLIALVTGAAGTCPAYPLMGISTAGRQ
jgi:hypothetical protein